MMDHPKSGRVSCLICCIIHAVMIFVHLSHGFMSSFVEYSDDGSIKQRSDNHLYFNDSVRLNETRVTDTNIEEQSMLKLNESELIKNKTELKEHTVFLHTKDPSEVMYSDFEIEHTMLDISDIPGMSDIRIPICVYARNDIVSNSILNHNQWEYHVQSAMFSHAPRKEECQQCSPIGSQCNCGSFVDIGANIGAHAIAMAALGFRVIAVEPNPNNIAMINCTLRMNPGLQSRITVINALASDEPRMECDMVSRMDWNIGNTNPICGRTAEDRSAELDRMRSVEPGRLDYVVKGLISDRLDNLLREANEGELPTIIDAFKIDVERYEPHVLAGAKEVFETATVHSLSFECTANWNGFWFDFLNQHSFVDRNGKQFSEYGGCPEGDVLAIHSSNV